MLRKEANQIDHLDWKALDFFFFLVYSGITQAHGLNFYEIRKILTTVNQAGKLHQQKRARFRSELKLILPQGTYVVRLDTAQEAYI